jgi:hypothetical protein
MKRKEENRSVIEPSCTFINTLQYEQDLMTTIIDDIVYRLGMSNRLKPYNRLLGQVSDRVPGYSVEN